MSPLGDRLVAYEDPVPFELSVSEWANSDPIDIASLRGRVVVVETFQMLCPGCVSHGLPQAQRVQRTFAGLDVTVLGLHTVFEHHDVTGVDALRAFIHEYRLGFPIAVDRASNDGPIPVTMARYQLQGTPSTLLIDRAGRLRLSMFGAADDLVLGAQIGELLTEPDPEAS